MGDIITRLSVLEVPKVSSSSIPTTERQLDLSSGSEPKTAAPTPASKRFNQCWKSSVVHSDCY